MHRQGGSLSGGSPPGPPDGDGATRECARSPGPVWGRGEKGSAMTQDPKAWLFRQIVEKAMDTVICAGREGLIRLWNAGAEGIFGHSAKEALGQSLDLIIPEPLRQRHWEGYHRVMAEGRSRCESDLLAIPTFGAHEKPMRRGTAREVRLLGWATKRRSRMKLMCELKMEHQPIRMTLSDVFFRGPFKVPPPCRTSTSHRLGGGAHGDRVGTDVLESEEGLRICPCRNPRHGKAAQRRKRGREKRAPFSFIIASQKQASISNRLLC